MAQPVGGELSLSERAAERMGLLFEQSLGGGEVFEEDGLEDVVVLDADAGSGSG